MSSGQRFGCRGCVVGVQQGREDDSSEAPLERDRAMGVLVESIPTMTTMKGLLSESRDGWAAGGHTSVRAQPRSYQVTPVGPDLDEAAQRMIATLTSGTDCKSQPRQDQDPNHRSQQVRCLSTLTPRRLYRRPPASFVPVRKGRQAAAPRWLTSCPPRGAEAGAESHEKVTSSRSGRVPFHARSRRRYAAFAEEHRAAGHHVTVPDLFGLFLYPGHRHLFADNSVADYDPVAAALLSRRVVDFLGRPDVGVARQATEVMPSAPQTGVALLVVVVEAGQPSRQSLGRHLEFRV